MVFIPAFKVIQVIFSLSHQCYCIKNLFIEMEDFEWNVLTEGKLLEAMIGHKPVGVNKYFQMACIWNKFTEELNKDVSSEEIWTHLESMYNLENLDEIESLPFPNDEREFYLPDTEFGALKAKKEEKIEEKINKPVPIKKPEVKEPMKNIPKEVKKEEKVVKKETPRRDSKDGKDPKTNIPIKKEVKKEPEKINNKQIKGRNLVGNAQEDKNKTPKNDDKQRQNKRPTRASIKPDEITRKSQSPLTVNPSPAAKRRRL